MKKSKSVFKMLVSIAMVMMFSLSLALPAFPADYSEGTYGSPAKAALTKIFQMAKGVDTPEATFKFDFEPISFNGNTVKDDLPVIDDVKVEFAANENPDNGTFGNNPESDTKSVVKETANFVPAFMKSFTDKLKETGWESAYGEGIYVYKVSENTEIGISLVDNKDEAVNEGVSYSQAEYTIEIWVAYDDLEKGYYVKYVSAKTIMSSLDDLYDEDLIFGNEKLDVTPGGPNDKTDEVSITDDFSEVVFTNKYWISYGGGEKEITKSALEIKKEVTGINPEYDKHFEFKIKVTQPSYIKDTGVKYMAYVLDNEDVNQTSTDNLSGGTPEKDSSSRNYIEFTSGATTTVRLLAEQRLVFVDLHSGATVSVIEQASSGYLPKYTRTFTPGFPDTLFEAKSANTTFGFPSQDDKGPHFTEPGSNVNKITFINHRVDASPMGVSIDNLPFVIMIGLGLSALLIIVAAKSRREEEVSADAI